MAGSTTDHGPGTHFMRSVCLESTFILSKNAVFRDLDGEAVILDLGAGVYFGLNTVGTRIWHLIERHGWLEAVLDELCREYDAARDELQRDLLELVARLAEARLVEVERPS